VVTRLKEVIIAPQSPQFTHLVIEQSAVVPQLWHRIVDSDQSIGIEHESRLAHERAVVGVERSEDAHTSENVL
jgi:hypothetical protein